jgi:tetratricopeptide (TPR) repeat protein
MFDWFNAREATETGGRLAKLLNAFRGRQLEKGVDAESALETTQTLVSHLTPAQRRSLAAGVRAEAGNALERPKSESAHSLLKRAEQALKADHYAESVDLFRAYIQLKSPSAEVLNSLGAALFKLERLIEAEGEFRNAVRKDSNHAEAQSNLGMMQLSRGLFAEAEQSLRRAVKLTPGALASQVNLGCALLYLNRVEDARNQFERVLRIAPRNAEALYGLGLVAQFEGQFETAIGLFDRALEAQPNMARAWAASAGLRKLGSKDRLWLEKGEQFASADGIPAIDRSNVHFALGKYYDDVEQHGKAFENYRLANEALKLVAVPYDRAARTGMVDDLIRVYTREAIAEAVASAPSDSNRPVFVVGMMRSGTSLVEQILASHPEVVGAGELNFWNTAVRKHEPTVRSGVLGPDLRKKLAREYLSQISSYTPKAQLVVDKATFNAGFLGVIHTVLPNVRIIYVHRDPVDTCLSCYFQALSPDLNFTMDLSDLAHYYREHRRLVAHWRSVLPPGCLLEVPYEELVADQANWTRRMLDFLGLPWDERCLRFHDTQRPVVTASFWQVRQKMYRGSIGRSRHYRKHIGPLLELKKG